MGELAQQRCLCCGRRFRYVDFPRVARPQYCSFYCADPAKRKERQQHIPGVPPGFPAYLDEWDAPPSKDDEPRRWTFG